MEDREIIDEFFQRDEDALRHTSEKYGQQLYRIALHYLFSPEDAQECVNDTCLAAWNAIPPVRPSFLCLAGQSLPAHCLQQAGLEDGPEKTGCCCGAHSGNGSLHSRQ